MQTDAIAVTRGEHALAAPGRDVRDGHCAYGCEDAWERTLTMAVSRVAAALRTLMAAASRNLGSDCYAHAEIGRALLKDLGFDASIVVGYAAWRVGRGEGDFIAHFALAQGPALPVNNQFAYHAWLGCDGFIIDFTTYQLGLKGQMLDAIEGGHTTVSWCPDFLLLRRAPVGSYEDLIRAAAPGVVWYESRPELASVLQPVVEPDPHDLHAARLILANPHMRVMGPRDFRERIHQPERAGWRACAK